jgi:ATP-dependent RNA helicase DHX29
LITKGIEFDNRLSTGFAPLRINEAVRDQVLSLALEEESSPSGATYKTGVTCKPATAAEMDKGLLRLFVAFHVLSRLGFSHGRISQCLLEGLVEGGGWDEAIDWVISATTAERQG